MGSTRVAVEDESIGLRSRLARLKLALRFIDEPLAVTLLKGVIEDIEGRIAAIESARQPHDKGVFSSS
jgi:hypothetical protein